MLTLSRNERQTCIRMPPLKQYFNRRLTARETIIVIAFVAILGGLGYLAYQFTTAKLLEARVNAALWA